MLVLDPSAVHLYFGLFVNIYEGCMPLLASAAVHLYFGLFSISVFKLFSRATHESCYFKPSNI